MKKIKIIIDGAILDVPERISEEEFRNYFSQVFVPQIGRYKGGGQIANMMWDSEQKERLRKAMTENGIQILKNVL